MECIYALRGPVTKCLPAWPALLRCIARDYSDMGVTYAELSLGPVIEADRLRTLQEVMPSIERETGVKLRFLAAMSRHDDLEWDLDYLDRLGEVMGSELVAGVDFMGHETNSTREFQHQIRQAALRAEGKRDRFVVRVHAGENPAYPENVRLAAKAVEGTSALLRVGHGLYGADEPCMAALRRAGAIVEFNLNSNLALNNIQSSREVPLGRYLQAGIPCVGTDGYGIYQSSLRMEMRAARLAGLTGGELATIRETESRYVTERTEADARCCMRPFVVPRTGPGITTLPRLLPGSEPRPVPGWKLGIGISRRLECPRSNRTHSGSSRQAAGAYW